MDERRSALAQRDERRAVANRQPVAEAHGESRHQIQPRSGTPRWEIDGKDGRMPLSFGQRADLRKCVLDGAPARLVRDDVQTGPSR